VVWEETHDELPPLNTTSSNEEDVRKVKNRHSRVVLAGMLVLGILLGAAIAQTLLAESEDFTISVTNESPMDIDLISIPEGTIYKNIWYDSKPINFAIYNYDENQDHYWFLRLTISGPVFADGDVVAQYRYRASDDAGIWGSWETLSLGLDGNNLVGDFANNFYLDVYLGTPWWMEFEIKFIIDPSAPPTDGPVNYDFLLELFEGSAP
jgi:hypothetical protein